MADYRTQALQTARAPCRTRRQHLTRALALILACCGGCAGAGGAAPGLPGLSASTGSPGSTALASPAPASPAPASTAAAASTGEASTAAAVSTAATASTLVASSAPVTISLIAINDFHGNLQPPRITLKVADPAGAEPIAVGAGGAAYLASLVATLKARNPANTIVVAAGDLIGASPMVSALFHDEPSIEAMGMLGLTVSSVGNHEFDKGRDELLRMQNGGCHPRSADGAHGIVGVDTCMNAGRYAGARFQYLAANVRDRRTGQTLFPAYRIESVAGLRIGFIGLTLKDTPAVVNPSGVAGLAFDDEVATVNALVPTLQQQGVAAIVVLLHQGGATSAKTVDDKRCPGFNGAILDIADRFDPAVAVVVSGHTHQEYICTRANGRLVTQAGRYGTMATLIDLRIDPIARRLVGVDADNFVAVNGLPSAAAGRAAAPPLPPQPEVDALVKRYTDLSAPITRTVVGTLAGPLHRTPDAAGESTLGDVIADAYLAATSSADYAGRPARIAFTNPGGLRTDLDAGPAVTLGALYSAQPFGNRLVTMTLSGAQLLRLLEQQWEAPQPPGGRVLQVSQGLHYAWDAAQPAGAAPGSGTRIVPGSLRLNGVALTPQGRYRITVNDFLAAGGDNFAILLQGSERQEGIADLDAAAAYLHAHALLAPPQAKRIQRRH